MTETLLVEIDFSNDGDYSDTGEDVSARVRGNPGITIERGRDQIRALSPPMVGAAGVELDNQSRDYSPENSGGPLYGLLLPRRRGLVTPTLSQTQTITPSLGGEELWTGDFEGVYVGGVAPNWNQSAGNLSESADAHGGTQAQQVNNSAGNFGSVNQSHGPYSAGQLIATSIWVRVLAGTGYVQVYEEFAPYNTVIQKAVSAGSYTQIFLHHRIANAGIHTLRGAADWNAIADTNRILVDDATQKILTLSSCIGTLIVGPTQGEWTSHPTLTAGTWAGMVLNWDGLSDGTQDLVLAYHDGTNAALLQCLAGVWTNVVAPTAAAYSAEAELKVVRATGTNTYVLWYNSVQIGSGTISAANIIANKGYAGFSTYVSNSCGAITATGGEYTLFNGYVDDIIQHPEQAKKSATFTFLDGLSKLRGQKVSTPLYQNIRIDQAIGYLLDAVAEKLDIAGATVGNMSKWGTAVLGTATFGSYGFLGNERVLDTAKTTLRFWWLADEDAFDALVKLLATEGPGSLVYVDGQGRVRFESRHYRILTTRCTTSQATLDEVSTSEPAWSQLSYDSRLKDVINYCDAEVKTREVATTRSVVWSLGHSLTIGPSESVTITASGSNPFTGAITPVPGTDYTLESGAVQVSMSRSSGANAEITLKAGASGASISGLQLRAYAVAMTRTKTIKSTIDATTSQTRYGERKYTLGLLAEINEHVAQDLVNAVVSMYQAPRTIISVGMINKNDTRLMQQLGRELSDRITVVDSQTGLNGDLWIERVAHEITDNYKVHRSVFGCEKVYAFPSTSKWGSAVLGSAVFGA